LKPDKNELRELSRILSEAYDDTGGKGPLLQGASQDPLDTLILTILSQATNDTNSGRAFDDLKRAFPDWEAVRTAPTSEVERAIARGGLAAQKAPRIQRILDQILEAHGSLDLDFLRSRPPEEAFRYLTSFDGVGPKTAACVLLFALDRPVFPVDTHILRVSKRLGLVDPRATAEKAQEILGQVIPPDCVYPLHINLIEHGRRVCRSRNPACEICVVKPECDAATPEPAASRNKPADSRKKLSRRKR